jgi:hypothetical protein
MPEATKPTEQPHHNHRLFSDHYLDETLPERPEWKRLSERARPVMEQVADLLGSYSADSVSGRTQILTACSPAA